MSTQLTIKEHVMSDAFRGRIANVLPKHVTPDRMVAVTLAALMRTPALASKDVDQASFFKPMMTLSELGLEPDGRLAHLIPFKNNRRGVTEVQLIIDYKGIVSMLHRSGQVSRIHCDVVFANDTFGYDCGRVTTHVPWWLKGETVAGDIIAAFCIVEMKDGSEKCEVMPKADIDAIRDRSRAGKSGPWVTDYPEMAKKTVFRRASKWLPISAEVQSALLRDDDQRPPIHQSQAVTVDAAAFQAMLGDARQEDSSSSAVDVMPVSDEPPTS